MRYILKTAGEGSRVSVEEHVELGWMPTAG
jgi:hypothetical protein